MDNVFFMKRVIRSISEGDFFRRVFCITLKCIAVLIAIGALVGWIAVWQMLSGAPSSVILGVIIFQVIFVITTYCIFHTIWIRANDIMALADTEFVVIPIVSVFVKLIGEALACLFVGFGIGAGILMWFGGNALYFLPRTYLPLPYTGLMPYGGAAGFLGGLLIMVAEAISAFLALVITYFISEQLRVFVDIAMNTKGPRTSAPQVVQPAAVPAAVPAAQPAAAPAGDSVFCPGCATKNERSAYFCVKCGYKLGGP